MNDREQEIRQWLAERPSDESIMKDSPLGSDKTYIELALEVGDLATINAVDDQFSNTPLHLAVMRGENDLALRLIAAGADVNALNVIKFNPVHFAVRSKSPSVELIAALIKAGADPNAVDKDGNTPLHSACASGKSEMAEALLNNGAERNAQDRSGRTPFYRAVEAGQGELANKLLAEYKCDPTINTYKNRTVYHAVAMAKDKKELSQVISMTDQVRALEKEKDIFGRTPEYYMHAENLVNTQQSLIVSNFKAYLTLDNRDPELFNQEGYCNGFTLLTHFWDSMLKHDIYKEVLEALVQWDKTPEGLQKRLEGALARYQTVGKLLETFLSPLTLAQQIRKVYFPLMQEGRDVQLALLGENEGFQQICQPMRIEAINSAQLEEFLEIVRHLPGNSRGELGGSGHVTAFKVNDKHEFQYSDSNFETTDWVTCPDAKSFVDVIIKTKYLELNKVVKMDAQGVSHIDDEVRIQSYVFQRENVPMATFNYFRNDELPQTREEMEKFIANSPSGFSPLHVVVLTNSKDNFSKMLDKDFCLEYLYKVSGAPWARNKPLDILFANRNEGMLNIFFDKMHSFSSDEQAVMQDKLRSAISSAASDMSKSMDTEGAQFVIRMSHYLDQESLLQLFQSTTDSRDPILLENMLKHHVFDRLGEAEFKSVVEDKFKPDVIKVVIKKHMDAPSSVEQEVEKYLVEMETKNEAQKENINDCRAALGTIKNPALRDLLLEVYDKNSGAGVPSVKQMEAFVSEVSKAQNHREFFKVIRESGPLLALFGDVKKEQFDATVAVKKEVKAEDKSVSAENKAVIGSPRFNK
ncbi:MAG TPA: ankyrin repeat domain-containing protein [Gammaproteobacteria bacterium]|nr:ankyrin repeat domain-containing protein [Gammaproteobacteria bacterium]